MKFTNLISPCAAIVVFIAASGAMAAGDIAKGKRLAKKCTPCHTLEEGGKNKLGPNLFGILGSFAASVKGYKYSKAMVSSGIIWDEAAFTEFMTRPKKFIKGTKMSFSGLKKATQRADLLAYFKTLTNTELSQIGTGDAAKGKVAAVNQCQVCHSFDKGGKIVFGPNLFGVYGKAAGAVEGYKYSKALLESGLTWTDANLIEFLANPEQFIKGTKAKFPGVKSAKMRADIIAYLKTLK
ncbi:MAG: c-type cytochrome [Proteobacteria bacterium]|nr:c-type cytochrome [Pseudomonadota bacterium]